MNTASKYLFVVFMLVSLHGLCQQDTMHKEVSSQYPAFRQHSVMISVSLGFVDPNRKYSVPSGFSKTNTTGYNPAYVKVEYATGKHFSLAGNFSIDEVVYNYEQLYTGYNGIIKRYKTNKYTQFGAGIIGCYHFGDFIKIRNLDPFAGVGVSLNNIHQTALPQGDSTLGRTEHTATPHLKVGARYYFNDYFSLFGDVGYDKESLFSIGMSCRFFSSRD